MSALNKHSNFENDPNFEEEHQLRKPKFHTSLHTAYDSKLFKTPATLPSSMELLSPGQESRKRRNSRNVMEVANIIIDLGDYDDTSDDSEGSIENHSELNLNATYSAKMGHSRYSKMLEALNEVDLADNVDGELEQFMSNLDIGSKTSSHQSSKDKVFNFYHQRNTNIPCTTANGLHNSKKRLCEAKSMDGLF